MGLPSVKGLFGRVRLSRKVLIIAGGVVVLVGGTGAAAVFIGADTLLGPSYAELNGMACTEVTTAQIYKKDRHWVRKYITTEPVDGVQRVKTALRIAASVYEHDKPDLVQVVVLDKNGPTDRADMRGRAVGADIIYIPDPSKVPQDPHAQVFTASFIDNMASPDGEFYGERINLPEDQINQLFSKLDDHMDCLKPEVEGEGDGEHGASAEGHGEPAAEHGAPSGHGEEPAAEGGHGESAEGGHGEAAPEHGEGGGDAGHGDETSDAEPAEGEGGGWFASVKNMVLGGDEAPTEGHGEDAAHGEATSHDAAATGHDAEAVKHDEASLGSDSDHNAVQPNAETDHGADTNAHGAAESHEEPVADDAAHAAPADHGAAEASAEPVDHSAEAPAASEAEEEKGWLDSITGLFGGGDDGKAEESASNGEQRATGIPEAGGDAEQAGAAWLAKLKGKPVAEGAEHAVQPAPAASEVPAEDSDILPPKASNAGHEGDHSGEAADAGH